MPMFVKFWGTRGSIPTPGPATRRYGGNTSCVEIRSGTTIIVCDAGSGMRGLGHDLLRRSGGAIEVHLLMSHTHWDHIQGFPFFAPAYHRSTRLRIYDLKESAGRFYSLLSGQMSSEYFPVRFADLKAHITSETITGGRITIGDIVVKAFPHLRHPGSSIAYSFESGPAKVVYATDSEVDLMLQGGGRDVPESQVRTVDPAFVEFVRGADLLIADAQYTDDEYPAKAGWGHTSIRTAVDLAIQAGVKRLAIFHHDPMRSDAAMEDLISACNQRATRHTATLQIFAAREGVELTEGTSTQPSPAALRVDGQEETSA